MDESNYYLKFITTHQKYTIEIIPSTTNLPSSPKRTNANNLSISNVSGKLYSFNTISQLDFCLNEIVEQITSKNLTRDRYGKIQQNRQNLIKINNNSDDDEFRLKINFGRELFTKINQTILNLSEWNDLKRGYKGITTAFRHDTDFFDEKKIEGFLILKKLT